MTETDVGVVHFGWMLAKALAFDFRLTRHGITPRPLPAAYPANLSLARESPSDRSALRDLLRQPEDRCEKWKKSCVFGSTDGVSP